MTSGDFKTWLLTPTRRPLIMGILNVTPDSFSDGGQFNALDRAVEHARTMVEQGAAIIDIGGESTRPGSDPIDAAEQIRRVVPAIERVRAMPCQISIDTTNADVAEAALDAGAMILNDISAGRDDERMLSLAASQAVPIVLMHMQGTPRTMQREPTYDDVVAEVRAFLLDRAAAAIAAGVARHRVLLDVGIGFGKSLAHNLALLRAHQTFADRGFATVLGTSRKGFIGALTNTSRAEDRIFGTAASVAWGVANGASIVRVHDVGPMRQVVQVIDAIQRGPDVS